MARNGDECEPVQATSARQIYCASNTCGANGSGTGIKGLHFYRFPEDARRCRQWIENCGNPTLSEKPVTELCQNTYLCRSHFDASQFETRDGSRRLKPDAVPTVFTPVNFEHLEMDHDYLTVLPRVKQPLKTKSPAVPRAVPLEVTVTSLNQSSTKVHKEHCKRQPRVPRGTTSNSSTSLTDTSGARTTEPSPTALAHTEPLATVAAVPQKASTGAPHRKQAASLQRKHPPVLTRRIAPSAKETPLQKYMLLCAEFKSELKLAEKRKDTLEKLFTGVQEVLFQEAELLNTGDTAILAGSLVKFLQERYCRKPDTLAERVLGSLWSKYHNKQPRKVQQRPFAQVAVFVTAKSQPGRVILGKRKNFLGGGLYQVPCGEIEFGETWEEAACREVFESTAMHVCNLSVCSVVDTVEQSLDYHAVTVFMRGTVDDSEAPEPEAMQPDLCDSWHWRQWQELPSLNELHWPLRDYKAEGLQPFSEC
ncbi:hypothetical protein HPB50_013612 [Hyalomma asiaticum]|uniref:Uncharacterized protein n=1 Tax=Hyalomma asiaticum TaxID=266040 RepID=A0ACB7RKQ9_HYAAI|nr:hypothetical protein HPB50_013612 [Hyalomma asiaticum]